MTTPQDKPPPDAGAVPRAFSPDQPTAPLPTQPPPWAYPHFPQPAPVVEVKSTSRSVDVAKLLGLVMTIGTFVFSAGALTERLKNSEENQKVVAAAQREHNRQQDKRMDDLSASVANLGKQLEQLAEQLRDQRAPRRPVRRDRESDRPMPPGP
jgi:uncharacterized protein HemX